MDFYNIKELLGYVASHGVDISPADRQEWALFGCALKMLGYSENDFIELSSGDAAGSRKQWRAEKNPGKYFGNDPDRAKGKIIALAKAAGVDVSQFRVTAPGVASPMGNRLPTAAEDFAGIDLNPKPPKPKPEPVFIPLSEVEGKAAKVESSALYLFLCSLYPEAEVKRVLALYKVGATGAFSQAADPGSVFPYMNAAGRCVDAHLMPYDRATGKRIREGRYCQDWLLRKMGKGERRAPWCLFGEHLKPSTAAPIGIVESEKTALIAAINAPGFVWMATGSLNNLTPERCRAVKECPLYLFPDADGLTAWGERAAGLAAEGFKVFLCGSIIRENAQAPKEDLADILNRLTAAAL